MKILQHGIYTIGLSIVLIIVVGLCQNSYGDSIITGDTQTINQSQTNVSITKVVDGSY